MPHLPPNYSYNSYIKDIYLDVPKYIFNHGTHNKQDNDSSKEKNEPIFIGREKIRQQFLNILKNGINGSNNGVYLVTGYRGMGKTSFVNKVINDYCEHKINDKLDPKVC
jgi:predicted AAA+ superfamily ATPase